MVCLTISFELALWVDSLPPVLQLEHWQGQVIPPYISTMQAAYHYLQIILHRPRCFDYEGVENEQRLESISRCDHAA